MDSRFNSQRGAFTALPENSRFRRMYFRYSKTIYNLRLFDMSLTISLSLLLRIKISMPDSGARDVDACPIQFQGVAGLWVRAFGVNLRMTNS